MTSRDFAYWLQGFFEISKANILTEEQLKIVKNHLNLVFHHELDKNYKEPVKAQVIHDGKPNRFFQSDPDRRIKC